MKTLTIVCLLITGCVSTSNDSATVFDETSVSTCADIDASVFGIRGNRAIEAVLGNVGTTICKNQSVVKDPKRTKF